MDILRKLDPQQRHAVKHGDGPLLIRGGVTHFPFSCRRSGIETTRTKRSLVLASPAGLAACYLLLPIHLCRCLAPYARNDGVSTRWRNLEFHVHR
jgi:hypothetical protein